MRNGYTGAVFAIKKGKDSTTVTAICETDRPTTTPANMPAAPKDELSAIQCPAGSHLLRYVYGTVCSFFTILYYGVKAELYNDIDADPYQRLSSKPSTSTN